MKRPLILLLTVLASGAVSAQGTSVPPRVVVGIVVDQLRTDYIETYASLYTDEGLRRVLREGVIFSAATFPSADVDRASATATIWTGTVPYNHGIVGLDWMDRQTLRPVRCVDDYSQRGAGTLQTSSPQNLLVSTLGDELKIATDGQAKVYGVAADRETAVLSAGHAADYALWVNGAQGVWAGTTFYGNAPSWASTLGAPSNMRNEWVASAAEAVITRERLGQDNATDLLCVNLSAATADGYKTQGGREVELEMVYRSIDAAIARIIDCVDKTVGVDNTLFFLTSTGYETAHEADLKKYRVPTGRIEISRCAALLNMYLVAIYGQGKYVEATFGNELYLDHKLLEQKQLNLADVLGTCEDFLFQYGGVRDVYTATRITQGAWTPGISRIRNAYNPKCSGDIRIEVNPGWTLVDAEQGQTRYVQDAYFEFPLIFFGNHLKAERIPDAVEMDRIAPTLAHFMRIRAPNACSAAPLRNFQTE